MRERKEEFGFSDYPKDHPNYGELNKKVVGKFKDETNAIPIALATFLREEAYSTLYAHPDKKGKHQSQWKGQHGHQ